MQVAVGVGVGGRVLCVGAKAVAATMMMKTNRKEESRLGQEDDPEEQGPGGGEEVEVADEGGGDGGAVRYWPLQLVYHHRVTRLECLPPYEVPKMAGTAAMLLHNCWVVAMVCEWWGSLAT